MKPILSLFIIATFVFAFSTAHSEETTGTVDIAATLLDADKVTKDNFAEELTKTYDAIVFELQSNATDPKYLFDMLENYGDLLNRFYMGASIEVLDKIKVQMKKINEAKDLLDKVDFPYEQSNKISDAIFVLYTPKVRKYVGKVVCTKDDGNGHKAYYLDIKGFPITPDPLYQDGERPISVEYCEFVSDELKKNPDQEIQSVVLEFCPDRKDDYVAPEPPEATTKRNEDLLNLLLDKNLIVQVTAGDNEHSLSGKCVLNVSGSSRNDGQAAKIIREYDQKLK